MDENTINRNKRTFELHCDRMFYSEMIGAHHHQMWELDYIKQGYGVHIFNGYSELCKEDELILLPSNVIHNWIIDPVSTSEGGRVETYTLLFNLQTINARLSVFPEMTSCLNYQRKVDQPLEIQGKSAQRIKMLILEMAQKSEIHQFPLFLQILIELTQNVNNRIIQIGTAKAHDLHVQDIMHKIHQYIVNNYTHHITLGEVADIAYMNKSAFCTFFKKHYTQNFFYVLNEHRINIACLLLLEEPIKEIADISLAVGFNDVPYFHRVFKKYKGCTPNGYRKKVIAYKNSIILK